MKRLVDEFENLAEKHAEVTPEFADLCRKAVNLMRGLLDVERIRVEQAYYSACYDMTRDTVKLVCMSDRELGKFIDLSTAKYMEKLKQ